MIKATVVCLAVTWAGAVVSQKVKTWWANRPRPEYANLPIKKYSSICNHPWCNTSISFNKHGVCKAHLSLYKVKVNQYELPTYVEGGWKQ